MQLQHPKQRIARPAPADVREAGNPGVFRPIRTEGGSVLIIVLWVAIGLVSIALYFANQMTYELRASDNRVSGLQADQAIEGAARYVSWVLYNQATNGAVPVSAEFHCEAVPVGDAQFWVIGRDLAAENPSEPVFGLVDEGRKLSLNDTSTNVLEYLPNISYDFAEAIMDWRSTNGTLSLNYNSMGYLPKYSVFETVDELRLVYDSTPEMLVGEDINRNGVLDKTEKDENSDGVLDPGLFEYVTVYTREPNFHANGSTLTNVNNLTQAQTLALFQNLGSSHAQQLWTAINNRKQQNQVFNGLLDFALLCRNQGVSSDDFGLIEPNITASTNDYIRGRVNVNTACENVMVALFMGVGVDEDSAVSAAQTLVNYREQNSAQLSSIGWVIDALGNNHQVVSALARGDYVTTRSYQFSVDIAAVGAYGRGYRRVKFIFDVSDGSPKILYRQDLSRLGWALGEKVRENLVVNNKQ